MLAASDKGTVAKKRDEGSGAAAASVRALLATHPESLVIAPGKVIDSGACERLEQALVRMGAGDARRGDQDQVAPHGRGH
jgi:hypothetical protein